MLCFTLAQSKAKGEQTAGIARTHTHILRDSANWGRVKEFDKRRNPKPKTNINNQIINAIWVHEAFFRRFFLNLTSSIGEVQNLISEVCVFGCTYCGLSVYYYLLYFYCCLKQYFRFEVKCPHAIRMLNRNLLRN